jgi:hypothetical protein
MFGVYLFCAVLGAGLVLLSLLGGGEHEAGIGEGLDSGGEAGEPSGHSSAAGELLLGLFRIRNLTFLLAGFGITGLLGTWFNAGGVTTAVLASVMGVVAMLVVHGTFVWLRRTDSATDVLGDTDLEGALARVVVPISALSRGRVSCVASGQQLFLTARLAEGQPDLPDVGSPVVILRMRGGVAEVAPANGLDLPSSID